MLAKRVAVEEPGGEEAVEFDLVEYPDDAPKPTREERRRERDSRPKPREPREPREPGAGRPEDDQKMTRYKI